MTDLNRAWNFSESQHLSIASQRLNLFGYNSGDTTCGGTRCTTGSVIRVQNVQR